MNTRNYHAHTRNKTYIENNQNGSGCIPDQQTATRYHKLGLVHSSEHKVYHSYHRTEKITKSTHDISFKFVLF